MKQDYKNYYSCFSIINLKKYKHIILKNFKNKYFKKFFKYFGFYEKDIKKSLKFLLKENNIQFMNSILTVNNLKDFLEYNKRIINKTDKELKEEEQLVNEIIKKYSDDRIKIFKFLIFISDNSELYFYYCANEEYLNFIYFFGFEYYNKDNEESYSENYMIN